MTDGATLIAHKGAQIVSREQLAQYIPPPATDTWKPVGHKELVDTLTQVMEYRGLHITREQFAVQNAKLFGTFDLEWMKMEEYGAAVGFRHATDKSMSIQIAVGARVFVCDNMSFSGEMIAIRKHTSKLDLGEEMDRAMYRYMQGFRRLQDDILEQKSRALPFEEGQQVICDVFSQRILPLKLFHSVCAAWVGLPNGQDSKSVWDLHNDMTFHIKTMPPAPAFRATARLGKFFAGKF